MESVEDIKAHAEDYFRTSFQEDRLWRPKVDGLQLPQLGDGEAE